MFDQNFGSAGDGYTQSNPHLRKMEKEAYLKGNMCFRDWEDGYKSSNPNILNERRIYKMSIKKWKNKELNGLLNERWGFGMNLGKLNEGCGTVEEEPLYEEEVGDGEELKEDEKEEFEQALHGSEAPADIPQTAIEDILDSLTVAQLRKALKDKESEEK
jgi:hypothetical protein